jgi:hypothetical protein
MFFFLFLTYNLDDNVLENIGPTSEERVTLPLNNMHMMTLIKLIISKL